MDDKTSTSTERVHRHRQHWGRGGKAGFDQGDRQGGLESFIDLFNRLAAQHGTVVTDGMVEGSVTPFDFFDAKSRILDDLDLWFEATGERLSRNLSEAEWLALECWLWEKHDRRRQVGRLKPKKSTRHDIPWPNAPAKWAPRRWFAWRPPNWLGSGTRPGLISVSRALNRARAETRAKLATEVSSGEWSDRNSGDGWWEDTSVEPITERNHPKPQGFRSVKKDGLTGRLMWRDIKWEPCEDVPPPESVLCRTHKAPKEPEPSFIITPLINRGYWRRVKNRPIIAGIAQMVLVSRSLDFDHDDLDRLATSAAIEAV